MVTPKLQASGFIVADVRQGFGSLSEPSKTLEADIADGIAHHDGNPVLVWMVGNAVADQDAAGNIKPSKEKSTERIDGVAAWVNALVRRAHDVPRWSPWTRSIYEDPDEGFFA